MSGDRESEVRYLAEQVGITEVHAECTPEEKVAITRAEVARAPTIFIGDGINDAPALVTATVGLAFGHQSEITADAAGAVVMDTSLKRVDELLHIARRMRAHRAAERRRRHGAERGRHGPGRGGPAAAGEPAPSRRRSSTWWRC